jgi:hypothetical protein
VGQKFGSVNFWGPKIWQRQFLGAKNLAAPISGREKFVGANFWGFLGAKNLAAPTFGGQKLAAPVFGGQKFGSANFLGVKSLSEPVSRGFCVPKIWQHQFLGVKNFAAPTFGGQRKFGRASFWGEKFVGANFQVFLCNKNLAAPVFGFHSLSTAAQWHGLQERGSPCQLPATQTPPGQAEQREWQVAWCVWRVL